MRGVTPSRIVHPTGRRFIMVGDGVSHYGRWGPGGLSSSGATMVACQEAAGEKLINRWLEYCAPHAAKMLEEAQHVKKRA